MNKTLERTLEAVANCIVWGGILLFLWVMLGAMFGAAWAAAAHVFEWLT